MYHCTYVIDIHICTTNDNNEFKKLEVLIVLV